MRNIILAAALATTCGSTAAFSAVFIDDFSVSQPSSTNDGAAGSTDIGSSLALTPNETRKIQTEIIANTAPDDARGRTAITAGSGALTYSSDDEVTGLGLDTYTFTGPISLLVSPLFQFTFLSNDSTGTFSISLTDSTGLSSSITYALPEIAQGAAPLVLTVPASLVGSNATGTINLASISQLSFSFGGTKSEDLSLDSIVAVPEPGPWGLALAAGGVLAGAGQLARRRRQA